MPQPVTEDSNTHQRTGFRRRGLGTRVFRRHGQTRAPLYLTVMVRLFFVLPAWFVA